MQIDLDEWEADCLAKCLESQLRYSHNPAICPVVWRERMLSLKARLEQVAELDRDNSQTLEGRR